MNHVNKLFSQSIVAFAIGVTIIFGSQTCPGWGGEHASQARVVIGALPELRQIMPEELLLTIPKKWCFYPDDTKPFMEEDIGKPAIDYLIANGFKNRQYLHSNSVPYMCKLLSEALREKNYAHAAVWIGALTHIIGDSAANNHDPLFTVFDYHFSNKGTKIIIGTTEFVKGIPTTVKMGNALKNPASKKILEDLEKTYKPAKLGDNPAEITRRLIVMPYIDSTAMTEICGRLSSAIQAELFPGKSKDEVAASVNDGLAGYIELLAIGARNTADVVNTVIQTSKTTQWDVQKQDIKNGEADVDAYLSKKPLSSDSIFDGLLHPDEAKPVFGVVVEPTFNMDQASMGFGSKYIAACIMSELNFSGIAYRTLDIRRVYEDGLPSPREVPALIVVAYEIRGFRWMKRETIDKKFTDYIAAGGRILWVGRSRPQLLGELSNALKEGGNYTGFKKETFNAGSIILDPALKTGSSRELPFLNQPLSPAGWHKPACGCVLTPGAKVKTLVELKTTAGTVPVGGMLLDGSGKVQHVFLPAYALFPQLIDQHLDSVKPIRLDPTTRKILAGTVNLFR